MLKNKNNVTMYRCYLISYVTVFKHEKHKTKN